MKNLSMLGAGLALALFSVVGQATVIKANYTVDLNDEDPGLVVQFANIASDPFTLDLTVGESHTFDLFDIWTDETDVGEGEDTETKPISVNFSFLLPAVFGGGVNGTTTGHSEWFLFFNGQWGELTWDGPLDLYFGPKNDGHLQIALSDETFNGGLYGLSEGPGFGATVQATLTLLQDATSVPAPGTLALLGVGVLGFAAAARRRRRDSPTRS